MNVRFSCCCWISVVLGHVSETRKGLIFSKVTGEQLQPNPQGNGESGGTHCQGQGASWGKEFPGTACSLRWQASQLQQPKSSSPRRVAGVELWETKVRWSWENKQGHGGDPRGLGESCSVRLAIFCKVFPAILVFDFPFHSTAPFSVLCSSSFYNLQSVHSFSK